MSTESCVATEFTGEPEDTLEMDTVGVEGARRPFCTTSKSGWLLLSEAPEKDIVNA